MENLPLETTENILSRLPMVLKIQSREVCKTWRTLVPKPNIGLIYGALQGNPALPNPLFGHRRTKVEAQFYFSEQNTSKVNDHTGTVTKLKHIILPLSPYSKSFMVGSCHGLVCYASYSSSRAREKKIQVPRVLKPWPSKRKTKEKRKICICNPVTGEQIQWKDDAYAEDAIGIGYNRSNNEYKFVRILQDKTFHVNTLRNGTVWRNKPSKINANEICFKPRLDALPSVGVLASGALHWMDKSATVVAFDLKHETFKLLPPIPSAVWDGNVDLMVLRGNLCVLQVLPSKHFRIWQLENRKTVKYTQKHSRWFMKFSIAWEDWRWLERVALPKSDKYFLWYNAILSCYDPETKTLKKLEETLKT
ncbi:F-box/kelch-repeat protein At3g23880-like [Papaver somniferum]|uniref:F-box/kelch-repeat protein At3g23880-like n=1 Tax=Papaver somniferum TaxID=3469 RepID=UPI000E6F8F90|nr:F-box/kelch-repeat protein At3g23880-like [Papaver somniferum]